MGRNVAIGIQNFGDIIENNYFYVDKTSFIKEWWNSGDSVTLITRTPAPTAWWENLDQG